MEERKLREIQIGTEDIFEGVILNVKRDQVQLPNGHQSVREVIRHVGAVCVVPVTADGKVVVERQYRYPIDQVITEIPAGKLDSKEEDRLHAAKRRKSPCTSFRTCTWASSIWTRMNSSMWRLFPWKSSSRRSSPEKSRTERPRRRS